MIDLLLCVFIYLVGSLIALLVAWLFGLLVDFLVGWLCRWVDWRVGGLLGWFVCFSPVTIYMSVCSFACSVWLVGRSVGWPNAYLFGWSASCLVSLFVCQFTCILVCFFVCFLLLFDYLFGWLNVRLCLLVSLCFIPGSFVCPFLFH